MFSSKHTIPTLAALVAGVAALALPATASAAASCSYNPVTHVLVVNANGSSAHIVRSGSAIEVNGSTCGTSTLATVFNTKRVRLQGGDGMADAFQVDLGGGNFAPGYGSDTGSPEIEFFAHPGTGVDELLVWGGAGGDHLTAGAGGVALNGDSDVDLTVVTGSFDDMNFYSQGGDDRLSGMGGFGTGSPAASLSGAGIDLIGGAGNDRLLPGPHGGEIISGDSGIDTVDYLGRGAGVLVSLDSSFDDGFVGENDGVEAEHIVGTKFADELTGNSANNRIWPLGGNDYVHGGAGNDTLHAMGSTDGNDHFEGGSGFLDRIDYGARTNRVHVALDNIANDGTTTAGEADDIRTDVEVVSGGSGNDLLIGTTGTQYLYGRAGNDRLVGSYDHDYHYGGHGDDVIHATDGLDEVVNGGHGFDKAFVDAIDYVTSIENAIVS